MPLWLLVYRFLTSDPDEEISLPFYQLGGTLVAICLPLITGALIQRYTDRLNPRLEPGVHTTCFFLTLAVFTVGVQNMWNVSSLVTSNLVIAAFALPLAGCFTGVVVMVPMKRTASISATKTIVSVSAFQNTLLAAVVQQSSYTKAQASAMHAGIVCFELASLCVMYLLYALHVLLWFSVPSYRALHDITLIQGRKRPSIAEQMVRNMIKAGEISFKKHDPRVPVSGQDDSCPSPDSERSATGSNDRETSGDSCSVATTGTQGFGFVNNGRHILDTTSVKNVSQQDSPDLSATGARGDIFRDHSGSSNMSAGHSRQQLERDPLCFSYDMLKLGVMPGTKIDLCSITNSQTEINILDKSGTLVKQRTNIV